MQEKLSTTSTKPTEQIDQKKWESERRTLKYYCLISWLLCFMLTNDRERINQLEGEVTKLANENRSLQEKITRQEREIERINTPTSRGERSDEGEVKRAMENLLESERKAHSEQLDSLFLEKRQLTQNLGTFWCTNAVDDC